MTQERDETFVNTGCVVNWGNLVGFLLQLAQTVVFVLCIQEVTGNHVFSIKQTKYFQGSIFVSCAIWAIVIAISPKYSGLDERTSFWCEWAIFTAYTGIATWLWWNMDQRFDGANWDKRHSTTFGDVNIYWQSHYYNILIATCFFWPWLPVLHFLSHLNHSKNQQRASLIIKQS